MRLCCVSNRFEHVKVDQKQKQIESEMAINRFHLIVGKPFKGQVDATEMDKYKFGSVRSFQTYLNFSGVTFEEGKNDTESCEQLHWVPYTDPTEVEELVGGGWKLYPNGKDGVPPMKAPHLAERPPVEEDPEDTDLPAEEHDEEAHKDTGADGGEEHALISPKLRQEMSERLSKGASNGSVWIFLFAVAGFLFVMLSNDGFSRGIRRQFRSKSTAAAK